MCPADETYVMCHHDMNVDDKIDERMKYPPSTAVFGSVGVLVLTGGLSGSTICAVFVCNLLCLKRISFSSSGYFYVFWI